MYFLGFFLIGGGIANLFIEHPDEHFYDYIMEKGISSNKIINSIYAYNKNYYYQITYKF